MHQHNTRSATGAKRTLPSRRYSPSPPPNNSRGPMSTKSLHDRVMGQHSPQKGKLDDTTTAHAVEAVLVTDVESPFYNSLRVEGKLDSSPMELRLQVASKFQDGIQQLFERFQRTHSCTMTEAVDGILSDIIHVEPIYYDGAQPYIFCPDTSIHEKHVDLPKLSFQWHGDSQRGQGCMISVLVQRNLPLSTNHRGARFRLGIIVDLSSLGGHLTLLYTSSFEVLAKQGRNNKRKQLYWPKYRPVSDERGHRLKQLESFFIPFGSTLYSNGGPHVFSVDPARLDQMQPRGDGYSPSVGYGYRPPGAPEMNVDPIKRRRVSVSSDQTKQPTGGSDIEDDSHEQYSSRNATQHNEPITVGHTMIPPHSVSSQSVSQTPANVSFEGSNQSSGNAMKNYGSVPVDLMKARSTHSNDFFGDNSNHGVPLSMTDPRDQNALLLGRGHMRPRGYSASGDYGDFLSPMLSDFGQEGFGPNMPQSSQRMGMPKVDPPSSSMPNAAGHVSSGPGAPGMVGYAMSNPGQAYFGSHTDNAIGHGQTSGLAPIQMNRGLSTESSNNTRTRSGSFMMHPDEDTYGSPVPALKSGRISGNDSNQPMQSEARQSSSLLGDTPPAPSPTAFTT